MAAGCQPLGQKREVLLISNAPEEGERALDDAATRRVRALTDATSEPRRSGNKRGFNLLIKGGERQGDRERRVYLRTRVAAEAR